MNNLLTMIGQKMKVTINGNQFAANNVTITNDSINIDGNASCFNSKQTKVSVEGDVESIITGSGDVVVESGNIDKVQTGSGNISYK